MQTGVLREVGGTMMVSSLWWRSVVVKMDSGVAMEDGPERGVREGESLTTRYRKIISGDSTDGKGDDGETAVGHGCSCRGLDLDSDIVDVVLLELSPLDDCALLFLVVEGL